MKMPRGTEVGLSSGATVLDGAPPLSGPCVLLPNG